MDEQKIDPPAGTDAGVAELVKRLRAIAGEIRWREFSQADLIEEAAAALAQQVTQLQELSKQKREWFYNTEHTKRESERADKAEAQLASLRAERDRLQNDLADALDLKNGVGPTVLTALSKELETAQQARDELQQKVSEAFDDAVLQEGKRVELQKALAEARRALDEAKDKP